jgi:hypothetical protein
MHSTLSIGRGWRVWWSLFVGRFAVAIGRNDGLREWSMVCVADRINELGQHEIMDARVFGWLCVVRWRVSKHDGPLTS